MYSSRIRFFFYRINVKNAKSQRLCSSYSSSRLLEKRQGLLHSSFYIVEFGFRIKNDRQDRDGRGFRRSRCEAGSTWTPLVTWKIVQLHCALQGGSASYYRAYLAWSIELTARRRRVLLRTSKSKGMMLEISAAITKPSTDTDTADILKTFDN